MKRNFTLVEIVTLIDAIGSKLHVSTNRAGNIKVVNHNEPDNRSYFGKTGHGFWVLYHNANGYLWRRHDGTGYAYPLNMKRGERNYWGSGSYNIEDSYFKTFDEAVEYFKNYLKKYRNISL